MQKVIGFVGLGNMGKGMAVNLARAGVDLHVYDLDPKLVAELVGLGAKAVRSNGELGAVCDIIEIVVVNDRQVEQVVFGDGKGDDGILATARPGTILVIHSTVHPDTCRRIAEAAAKKNVGVIDAAVSGAEARSKDGSLTLMVGGPEELVAACRPVFEIVGDRVFHLGEVGRGQVAKLCNNLMSIVNLATVEEGLRLAQEAGIDEAQMIEIASVSTGESWALHGFGPMRDLLRARGVTASIALIARKDVALAVDLAESLGVKVPIAKFVVDLGRS
jgi:3-hydroxyisobutyrate dehydrogenase-like beta-hydroxyacid dehydrogenase